MAESTTPPTIPSMNPQQAQAYKDATDNLIYLKREQFQVSNCPKLKPPRK